MVMFRIRQVVLSPYNILYIFIYKMVVYYIIIYCKTNIFKYTTLSHSKKDIISKCSMQLLYNSYAMYNLYILFVTMSKVVFESGDLVNLPIYWKGIIIEHFGEKVIVQFSNPMFWLRSVPKNLFDYGTEERIIKKKKIEKNYDEQYFDMSKEDDLITNDMLV